MYFVASPGGCSSFPVYITWVISKHERSVCCVFLKAVCLIDLRTMTQ